MPSVAAPAEAKPISAITRTRCVLAFVWVLLYSSFTLMTPPLLDDADSVHAEVAREMITRNDWVTLYANGIRYLEKAPLLYWSMASSFRIFGVNTGAARVPLALTVLLLAMAMEAFARLAFGSTRAGLTAGLITLSSFGIFIFTRITIPDAMVCLWITLAVFCYWLTLQRPSPSPLLCWGFAACCALNVLTKGLIGIVFPVTIVLLHLLLMDGPRGVIAAVRQLYPISSAAVFLLIATPWHVLAGEANPTEGHPGGLTFLHGHWSVPLPTPGNVHGWTWFYFMNEHVLRYLNLRVPRDYDTVPLWLFYGLVLVWLMPWSAYLWSAVREVPWIACIPWLAGARRQTTDARGQTRLLLGVWAAVVMLFFSFSTILPSLSLALLFHPVFSPLCSSKTGKICPSVLKTTLSNGMNSFSPNKRNKYFRVPAIHHPSIPSPCSAGISSAFSSVTNPPLSNNEYSTHFLNSFHAQCRYNASPVTRCM